MPLLAGISPPRAITTNGRGSKEAGLTQLAVVEPLNLFPFGHTQMNHGPWAENLAQQRFFLAGRIQSEAAAEAELVSGAIGKKSEQECQDQTLGEPPT